MIYCPICGREALKDEEDSIPTWELVHEGEFPSYTSKIGKAKRIIYFCYHCDLYFRFPRGGAKRTAYINMNNDGLPDVDAYEEIQATSKRGLNKLETQRIEALYFLNEDLADII